MQDTRCGYTAGAAMGVPRAATKTPPAPARKSSAPSFTSVSAWRRCWAGDAGRSPPGRSIVAGCQGRGARVPVSRSQRSTGGFDVSCPGCRASIELGAAVAQRLRQIGYVRVGRRAVAQRHSRATWVSTVCRCKWIANIQRHLDIGLWSL